MTFEKFILWKFSKIQEKLLNGHLSFRNVELNFHVENISHYLYLFDQVLNEHLRIMTEKSACELDLRTHVTDQACSTPVTPALSRADLLELWAVSLAKKT